MTKLTLEQIAHEMDFESKLVAESGLHYDATLRAATKIAGWRDRLLASAYRDEAAARSAAHGAFRLLHQIGYTPAVSDCPHCNIRFLAEWVLDALGPEPGEPPPGPPDPPRKRKPVSERER